MKRESQLRRGLLAASLTVALGLSAGSVFAAEAVNPDADEILRSMSTFLAGTKAFSVSADIGNEIIALDGQKLEFNANSTLLLQRPSNLQLTRQGRFVDLALYFDGRQLTVCGKTINAYVQKDLAGTIDDALNELEGGMGVSMPGADLLLAAPYAALSAGITGSSYLGTAYVQGVECHHLAFRKEQVDWQLWVRAGDEPLPMKYVITTKWLTGAPQYSVQFRDWNTKPAIAAGQFKFTVPKDAEKLASLPVDETGELAGKQEGK
jgi:hypothetical protein